MLREEILAAPSRDRGRGPASGSGSGAGMGSGSDAGMGTDAGSGSGSDDAGLIDAGIDADTGSGGRHGSDDGAVDRTSFYACAGGGSGSAIGVGLVLRRGAPSVGGAAWRSYWQREYSLDEDLESKLKLREYWQCGGVSPWKYCWQMV